VRVAAISDIHGNLPALEAVLADVEREGFDLVVVVGDTVTGPFSAGVFDRVTSVPAVRFVRGNVERLVIEGADEHGRDWNQERVRLGDDRLAAVASWPRTIELELDSLGRTLFCHSTASSEDPIYTRITPEDELLELFAGVEADVVVCGHTHIQYDRRLPSGLRLVNPGSVGMPYEGRRGAYWAALGPDVELCRSEYDVDAAVRAIEEQGAPVDEQHIALLLDPMDSEAATAEFEAMRGA